MGARDTKERLDANSRRDPRTGCILWTGAVNNGGYGCLRIGPAVRGAHVVAWMLARGSLPLPGFDVCHRCDNRRCVKPDHLFLGTRSDNMRDCISKGRWPKHRRSAA